MSDKTIVEINGVKLEIDLRQARRIEDYKVGDNVKVLIKKYGDQYESHPGVLIGFDHFEKLPTIIICYCDITYSNAEIKFVYFNSQSKDVEICHMSDHEKVVDRHRAENLLNDQIIKKQNELDDLLRKKNYFQEKYNQHFIIEKEVE